jgi:hypothetical protein
MLLVSLPVSHAGTSENMTVDPANADSDDDDNEYNNNSDNSNNSVKIFVIYERSQRLQGQLQTQHSIDTGNYIKGKHNI